VSTSSRPCRAWLLAAVLLLTGLRLVHLEADTPRELATFSVGVFVDEGYKTLPARNLVLFGSTSWHPQDDYVGWMGRSPLTQWPFYLAFRASGVELASVRVVTVLWFALLLGGFGAAGLRRYRPWVVGLGLLLLATQHTVFFFSRLALLEIPAAVFLYGFLFVLAAGRAPPRRTLALFAAFALAGAVGVKISLLLYFALVAAGLVLWRVAEEGRLRSALAPATWSLVPLALAAWVLRAWWAERIGLDLRSSPQRFAVNSLLHSTAPLVAAGLCCGLHALAADARGFLRSPYRAGLLALGVLGPLALTLLSHRPLRYYVPLIPAYALLVVEWVHLRPWRTTQPVPRAAWAPLALVAAVALPSAVLALQRHVVARFVPGEPSLTVLALASLALAVAWVLARRRVVILVVALIALASARDARVLGRFWSAPTYHARNIGRALEALVPPGNSVAGDWAPFLALGTPLRTLYTNPRINRPEHFVGLAPDYFVYSGGRPWRVGGRLDPLVQLRRDGVRFDRVHRAEYAGRTVEVHRLEYPDRYRLEPPTTYCETTSNSTGAGARIGSSLSPSLSVGEFALTVAELPPGAQGRFFYGAEATSRTFAGSTLCVLPPLHRVGPVLTAGQAGRARYALDLTSPPLSSGPGSVSPGSTWHFQFVYRDPAAPGSSAVLSDALRVTFRP
jgi:hypothetical protein